MLRSLGWILALLLSLGALHRANAADLPVKSPPLVAPAFSWTGFYAGLHGGADWYTKDWSAPLSAINIAGGCPGCPIAISSNSASGWLAGGQAGFNLQISNWVLGVEADASWTSLNGSSVNGLVTTSLDTSKVNALGTVAARAGVAVNNALLYLKGGAAWADDRFFISRTVPSPIPGLLPVGAPIQLATDTRWGWMVGFGLEYALTQNWSIKAEYDHLDLGSRTETLLAQPSCGCLVFQYDIKQRMDLVKVGFNYRFDGMGPVVAKY
jgi:outer membrane immunogenic protein